MSPGLLLRNFTFQLNPDTILYKFGHHIIRPPSEIACCGTVFEIYIPTYNNNESIEETSIVPSLHEKLTKVVLMSSLTRFKHC